MDVLRDQDPSVRRATLSRILKTLRKRSGLRTIDMARAMNKGHRTYQRWETGYYGIEVEATYRFAEIVGVDPWGIILGAEFGSVEFALDTAHNNGAELMLVAFRRFYLKSGPAIRKLDPRSLLLTYARGFELLAKRAEKYEADLEQWMFDEGLGAGDDDDEDGDP